MWRQRGVGPKVNLSTEIKASFFDLGIEDRKKPASSGSISEEVGDRYWSDPETSHGTTMFGGEPGKYYAGEAYVRLIVTSGNIRDDYLLQNAPRFPHP